MATQWLSSFCISCKIRSYAGAHVQKNRNEYETPFHFSLPLCWIRFEIISPHIHHLWTFLHIFHHSERYRFLVHQIHYPWILLHSVYHQDRSRFLVHVVFHLSIPLHILNHQYRFQSLDHVVSPRIALPDDIFLIIRNTGYVSICIHNENLIFNYIAPPMNSWLGIYI